MRANNPLVRKIRFRGTTGFMTAVRVISHYSGNIRINYLPCTRCLDELPFLMLWNCNKDTPKPFWTDDKCLTLLCQHVQLRFVKHMDRIKYVGLILNVLYHFPFCMACLVHHPDLPTV